RWRKPRLRERSDGDLREGGRSRRIGGTGRHFRAEPEGAGDWESARVGGIKSSLLNLTSVANGPESCPISRLHTRSFDVLPLQRAVQRVPAIAHNPQGGTHPASDPSLLQAAIS